MYEHVLELAEDGEITKWTKEDIAEYASFPGDPEKFYTALHLNCDGFIDLRKKRVFIHDWWDSAGKYLKTKYKTSNPERLAYIESLYIKATSRRSKGGLKADKIDKIDKIILDRVRLCYLSKKNWDEKNLRHDDFGRIHKAIKILYVKAEKNVANIEQAIEWVSRQGYCDWTMETVIKKWPDFLKRQQEGLQQLKLRQHDKNEFKKKREQFEKEGLISESELKRMFAEVGLKKK